MIQKHVVKLVAGALILVAVCTTIFFSLPQPAQQTQREITVAFVGSIASPDYQIKTDRFFYALLENIAAQEGWEINYRSCSWVDCIKLLQKGEIDLLPELTFTSERQQQLNYHSIAVIYSWSQVYTTQSTQIRTFSDLANRTIATESRTIQESDFDALMKKANLPYEQLSSPSIITALRNVKEGRAYAAIVDNLFGRAIAHRFDLIETPLTFNQAGVFFGAPKDKNEDLLQRIDHHLNVWMQDPNSFYYQRVRELTVPISDTKVSTLIISILWITSGALVVLGLVSVLLRWTVKQRTAELRSSNQRMHHLMNSSPSVIYSLDPTSFDVAWASENIYRILGFTADEVTRAGWWNSILHPEDRVNAIRLADQITKQGHLNHEYRVFDVNGKVRYLRDEMEYVSNGDCKEIIGTWTDVTSDFEQQAQLRYLTHYDPLTGLPNRQLLYRRFAELLKRKNANTLSATLLWIDFDRFKIINDHLGNALGDQVLAALAERIKHYANTEELLSRTSADEFCLILQRHYTKHELEEYIARFLQLLKEPLEIEDQSLVLTASIGVSVFPEHGDAPEQLLINAELAMFAAKKQGGNCFCFYTPQFSKVTSEKFLLENDLRHAITNQELLLHYQPKFDLASQQVVGVEALVRWQHPRQGMVSPAFFIPLAEEIGIIADIDSWVLMTACEQLKAWDAQGFHVPHVAVNLSASEFENHRLAERIDQALQKTHFSPQRLEIEITETMLMRTPETAIPILNQLHSLGISVAMDDFGTGYSNFAHLGRLPIDSIKIDQSFVKEVGRSAYNESIIRAIIALARALDLNIVAEGIETAPQQRFLLDAGCDVGQGFLLARPMAADALRSALKSNKFTLAAPVMLAAHGSH